MGLEKALEKGISFHRCPIWETWRWAHLPGTLRDGWRGLCGWSVHLSLKRLRGGGLRCSSFTGDPGRCVEKVSGYGHLRGAPFQSRETWYAGGGSYTGDFDRWTKEGSSGGASLYEGFH